MGSTRTLMPAIVASLLALCVGMGCSDDEPTTPKPAPPAETIREPVAEKPVPPLPPTKKPESIQEQLAESVDLPDFYPKDAPVFPGAKASSAGWQAGRVSAIFSGSDSADQVATHARAFLGENGWTDIQNADLPNGRVVSGFKHDEDRKISVLISELSEGGKDITLIAVSTDP